MTRHLFVGPAILAILLSACKLDWGSSSEQPTGSAVSRASAAPCRDAPQALVDRLDKGLLVRGAYVSNVSIGPADGLATVPAGIGHPQWAAGKINGAGARPEVGIWLWGLKDGGGVGSILAANASAGRYFDFDTADQSLAASSDVVASLVACAGPIEGP